MSEEKKPHWTQTPEGKKRLRRYRKRYWRAERRRLKEAKAAPRKPPQRMGPTQAAAVHLARAAQLIYDCVRAGGTLGDLELEVLHAHELLRRKP